jgi:hypothetical protein
MKAELDKWDEDIDLFMCSRQSSVAICCEHSNVPSDSMEGRKYADILLHRVFSVVLIVVRAQSV